LYITSLGVHEVFINGQGVGDVLLSPGWTSYRHRLNYLIYDVREFLRTGGDRDEGKNVICVEVAEGWYAGRLGFGGGRRFIYGDELGILVQLEISDSHGK
jgi:alpha-L-rhamnosidase